MPKYKRKTPLVGITKDGQILSEKEEKFCLLYVAGVHRIDAIGDSYSLNKKNPMWRSNASVMASENLIKPRILTRIRELLDSKALNDDVVDTELSFVISQHDNLHAKTKGIELYAKLKGRFAPERHEHKFKGVTDAEITERLAAEVAGIVGDDRGAEEAQDGEPV